MAEETRSKPGIVIAGGGTGGHVFPALAVAGELRHRHPRAEIVFVGGARGLENRLVPRAGYPLRTLRVRGLKGAGGAARIGGALAAVWAVLRCLGWMVRHRPDLTIGVGGYASGPAVLAAKLLGVKTMVMEQNHFPGATNRWLAPRVDAVCVPSEEARHRLGGLGIVTGNPVREEFTRIGERPAGGRFSVLVAGGSRGARSINRAVVDALPLLARMDPPPVITVQTGTEDEPNVASACRRYAEGQAEARAFLDDMPQRMEAADLVVCRAGATTLAELAAAGRPAILIPYPYAADDHQRRNAETVAEAGAAELILDADLDGPTLAAAIRSLAADPARLAHMGRAARGLARLDAAARIADVADRFLKPEKEEDRVS